MPRPSETALGAAWLDNFEHRDQAAAAILIDSLRVVSLDGLWSGIDGCLLALQRKGEIEGPALVLPEMSLKYFGLHGEARTKAVAYEDFEPGRPDESAMGSDAFVGMLLRDIGKRTENPEFQWIPPQTTLAELRERRCRWILVVSDFLGTGRQVTTFTRALARHKTIRSWRSFGLVKIGVVAFAASEEAIALAAKSRSIDRLWTVEVAPTIWKARWTPEIRDAVVELCLRESRLKQRDALGYKESGGLFATARGAPNNLPALLIQEGDGWRALFPNRAVPTDFATEVDDYKPTEPFQALARRIGQLRLGQNDRIRDMRAASRQLVKALAVANDSGATDLSVARELGIDRSDAARLVESLRKWGFVGDAGAITGAGRAELAAHKRGRRRTTAFAEGDRRVYYPQHLR